MKTQYFSLKHIISLSLLILTLVQCNQKDYAAITYGPSGNGKSSSINTMAGKNLVEQGDGSGYSTTLNIREVNIQIQDVNLYILDVPGLRDNQRVISDKEITKQIFLSMAEKTIDSAYILLYHSLDNPNSDTNKFRLKIVVSVKNFENSRESQSHQLHRSETINLLKQSLINRGKQQDTLSNLQALFGEQINKSILVMLTKQNVIANTPQIFQKKIDARFKECEKLHLAIMIFDTECPDFKLTEKQREIQNQNFIRNLSKLKPFKPTQLDEYNSKVFERAIQLQISGETYQDCKSESKFMGGNSPGVGFGTGAILGSPGGPATSAIGAVIGGLIGLISDYKSSKNCETKQRFLKQPQMVTSIAPHHDNQLQTPSVEASLLNSLKNRQLSKLLCEQNRIRLKLSVEKNQCVIFRLDNNLQILVRPEQQGQKANRQNSQVSERKLLVLAKLVSIIMLTIRFPFDYYVALAKKEILQEYKNSLYTEPENFAHTDL